MSRCGRGTGTGRRPRGADGCAGRSAYWPQRAWPGLDFGPTFEPEIGQGRRRVGRPEPSGS
ncbi:hypothetical protein OB03_13340 [Brevundimonas sp. GN22]